VTSVIGDDVGIALPILRCAAGATALRLAGGGDLEWGLDDDGDVGVVDVGKLALCLADEKHGPITLLMNNESVLVASDSVPVLEDCV